jgi:hypothetical protein
VVVKIRKTKKNFSHFCLKKNLKKKKCFFFFFSFQKCPGRLYIYFTVLWRARVNSCQYFLASFFIARRRRLCVDPHAPSRDFSFFFF